MKEIEYTGRRMAQRDKLARNRRRKHGAQIAAFLFRVLSVACFIGIIGAVGGIEIGGGILEGFRLMLIFAIVGGFGLLASAAIEKAVRM